jgi:phosphatidylserine/phosphatidylglycerophosphate/cardiolipin synthase-like enzyme
MGKSTHQSDKVYIDEVKRTAKGTAQWLLEKKSDGVSVDYVTSYDSYLDPISCGKESFERIAADIRAAKKSIDIICYAFDPAMELERRGSTWPRGATYGQLLTLAAKKGVKVRLLAWLGIAHLGRDLRGLGDQTRIDRIAPDDVRISIPGYLDKIKQQDRDPKARQAGESETAARQDYNAQWFADFRGGEYAGNLVFKTRDLDDDDAKKALASEGGQRGFIEEAALKHVATHHQKTILIDYEFDGGSKAVGYVMGLNSVTDYWDTTEHKFDDPLRGAQWEGGDDGSGATSLKPFQDYVCRVQGGSLFALHRNFAVSWNKAKLFGGKDGADMDPAKRSPNLAKALPYPRHSAQILRTQPESGTLKGTEKSIKALYSHAIDYALRYIYIENQYFQNTQWTNDLIAARRQYVTAYEAAPKTKGIPAKAPELHLMVVTPSPERSIMIPRTHDSISALGHGDSMPNQQKEIDEEIARHSTLTQAYQREVIRIDGDAKRYGIPPTQLRYPAKPQLGTLAQNNKDNANTVQQLKDEFKLNTLVASLWTYNKNWHEPKNSTWQNVAKAVHIKSAKEVQDEKYKTRYREIYIHSKLMIIDDSMFTLGSANLNTRSFATDSELNIATNEPKLSKGLRKKVWAQHTKTLDGGEGGYKEIVKTFELWQFMAQQNLNFKNQGQALTSNLVKFYDERTSSITAG